jgi:hypothetical protein
MGDITMTDSEWKERKAQVARYRAMERETTDPLAAQLLRDIVLDLEADSMGAGQTRSSRANFPLMPRKETFLCPRCQVWQGPSVI